MPDSKTGLIYKTKGSIQSLKSKGTSGIKIPVECLNLATKVVRYFGSVSEAGDYLQIYSKVDRKLKIDIGRYIRKPIPTPFKDHLWRVSVDNPKPWPDYSHLDITMLRKNNSPFQYPLYVLNVKTGEVHLCDDFDTVQGITKIGQSCMNVYVKYNNVYKNSFRFSHTKEGLYKEIVKKAFKRYIYHIYDTTTKDECQFDAVARVAEHTGSNNSTVGTKFHYIKGDVIYVGENNRYRITRVPQ